MPEYPYTNALSHEQSPYLLQHAHNPVNWVPWGEEAFASAGKRDIPVFLSIGYSTCHWCHVMERECFEDTEVAALLNQHFVCVKVDREERSDIDHLYMQACTAMTGQGGWPLTLFLAADRLPFFAGTYFPKHDRYGIPGLMTILTRVVELWHTDRARLLESGKSTMRYLRQEAAPRVGKQETDWAEQAYEQFCRAFDPVYGGFGMAPKFPTAYNLLFLTRYAIAREDPHAIQMVKKTLTAMGQGGIYDFIGGGFCRYATDRKWLVPHFEKMLYANALLAIAYAEGAVYLDPDYANTARRTIEYCIRDMRGEHGGFFTAQDADSEGVEGKYYVWSPGEVTDVLGGTDGKRFCELFSITGEGNFEGKSIPHVIDKRLSREDWDFAHGCFPCLLQARMRRVQPLTDDKVLAASNGFMIAALSICGRLLGESAYIGHAEQAAQCVLGSLTDGDRLLSRWREGRAAHPATSDDYAYLVWGLVELYQATFDPAWLKLAVEWTDRMISLFWDKEKGGLYLTGSDVSDLPLRLRNIQDGAVPSGNAVAAMNLVRLSRLTGNVLYDENVEAILRAAAEETAESPMSCAGLMMARLYASHGGIGATIADGQGLAAMLDATRTFSPFAAITVCGDGYADMAQIAPRTQGNTPVDGKATAYVCTPAGCRSPVNDAESLRKMLTVPEIR